jgi:NitT/TauT family transport system ATP-binding protein
MGNIVLDAVSKVYPMTEEPGASGVVAVDNVAMTIDDHQIVCLVGPSGCGKSTVLNMIAGFELPTSGRITVGDKIVQRAGPDRMVVFQSPALFGWMTVHQNIVFGPRKRGKPKAQYEADAARLMIASDKPGATSSQ